MNLSSGDSAYSARIILSICNFRAEGISRKSAFHREADIVPCATQSRRVSSRPRPGPSLKPRIGVKKASQSCPVLPCFDMQVI